MLGPGRQTRRNGMLFFSASSLSTIFLGQYYIGLIFIMFLATYCTTFTLGIQMQGNAGRPISRRVRSFLLSIRVNKSSILQWFFGKELMNTQETIKMRLKKYDKLSELKKMFANDFVNFQQKLLRTEDEKHPKLPLIDEEAPEEMAKKEMLLQEHVKRIRREWQMLARMLEKLIMWVFIICTIIFASVMLYDTQDPPVITDELMKERAK
ncbi:hypothetical protein OESDEN_07969 [Oesophagostomum dentatum]|uniref:Uncharacterized protein n=1 Tax=Oesophagostomum dentatum TaxID=61180 RepID=A0A0B1T3P6_OESDE|nr:hypothetical protein OESDEN_07969 [Oesophagostomum dentatum]